MSISCDLLTDTEATIEVTITPHRFAPSAEFIGKIYVSKAFDSEEDFADACQLTSGIRKGISDADYTSQPDPCLEVVSLFIY